METTNDERDIRAVLESYVRAYEGADADLMESLFWVDDPRFVEVENHIPAPFGRERYLAILGWIREHQKPGWRMRFYDTQVHILAPDVAYSVSMRDSEEDGDVETSRVTLVFLRKEGVWKIVHGHFSYLPK